jgi:hypothetical protein
MFPAAVHAKATGDAIIGTGADAIIGTGKGRKNAIIGTGADAIIGTGADAIIGTGADAIIGTGRSKVVLMGVVDSVDVSTKTISVLNRRLQIESAQKISDALAAGQQMIVAVSGKITGAGTIDQGKLKVVSTGYVPGASKVVVSGRVGEVNIARGTVSVSGQEIDINSAVVSKAINVGDVVLAVGTQPSRNGAILAERVY